MKNLKSLSDVQLVEQTSQLVRQEREALTQILWHLREIERRMLYAQASFPTLADYAVVQFQYSRPAAARRVAAMKLLKETM
jgi:hypothetical protein